MEVYIYVDLCRIRVHRNTARTEQENKKLIMLFKKKFFLQYCCTVLKVEKDIKEYPKTQLNILYKKYFFDFQFIFNSLFVQDLFSSCCVLSRRVYGAYGEKLYNYDFFFLYFCVLTKIPTIMKSSPQQVSNSRSEIGLALDATAPTKLRS